MKWFCIGLSVEGYVSVDVNAHDKPTAIKKARQQLDKFNYGEIDNVDFCPYNTRMTSPGNYTVMYSCEGYICFEIEANTEAEAVSIACAKSIDTGELENVDICVYDCEEL